MPFTFPSKNTLEKFFINEMLDHFDEKTTFSNKVGGKTYISELAARLQYELAFVDYFNYVPSMILVMNMRRDSLWEDIKKISVVD